MVLRTVNGSEGQRNQKKENGKKIDSDLNSKVMTSFRKTSPERRNQTNQSSYYSS